MTTAAAHDVSAPDAPSDEPPITYCPLHGLEHCQCGTWCLRSRWLFFYESRHLDEYFERVYRRSR
jgi:hypothetical protein